MLKVTIGESEAGREAGDLLRDVFAVSESYLRRLKRRRGALLLNGEPVYTTRRVQTGDVVSFDPADPEKLPIAPIPFPIPIVYEDEWLAVIDKPANFAVHPARDPNEPTVENALAAVWTGRDNPHPVTRLDKGTTGLMTVAKSGYVHARMKLLQQDGRFQKTYLAIVLGVPQEPRFVIDAPIGPLPGSTYQRCVRADGAEAKSLCETLASDGERTLVRLTPFTGRTHQLRVHMAYIGHPLLGDWLYGTRSDLIDRPALHAETLRFPHPITGETLDLTSPTPREMLRLIPNAEPCRDP